MGALISLVAVAALALITYLGVVVADLRFLFGVVAPGVAFAVFLVGVIYRIYLWARAPVPYRIPTTSGQQKSLPWLPHEELDNPSGMPGVLGRMFLEVFFFRSLFRNTTAKVLPDTVKVTYTPSYYLWAAAMAFHWSMLIIVLRHFRFFAEPAPRFVEVLQIFDGFFQVGLPVYYATSVLFLVGLVFLLGRRLFDGNLRYISLPSDYFALYLLLGIGGTGMLMRHLGKVDIIQVKHAIAGWASFQPVVPEGVGVMYFLHVFMVSALLVYLPFSKLLHMPGVFFSPTRNLANTNRKHHHENPWNPDLEGHTYLEWEEEFKDKLKASGYELEKE